MIQTLLYGTTIGAILYFFSIGLSITFGTMKIINFAHSMVYTLGVYFFITMLPVLGGIFPITCFHDACVVAENGFQPVIGLFAQFIPVANIEP